MHVANLILQILFDFDGSDTRIPIWIDILEYT